MKPAQIRNVREEEKLSKVGGTGVAKKRAKSDPSQEFLVDLIDPSPHPPKKTYKFPNSTQAHTLHASTN